MKRRESPDAAHGIAAMPRRGCSIARRSRTSLPNDPLLPIALPNVRAKRATTAGRQAWAGENVQRTTGPGLVACRWRSA